MFVYFWAAISSKVMSIVTRMPITARRRMGSEMISLLSGGKSSWLMVEWALSDLGCWRVGFWGFDRVRR